MWLYIMQIVFLSVSNMWIEKFGVPKQATISRNDSALHDGKLIMFPGCNEYSQWYFMISIICIYYDISQ